MAPTIREPTANAMATASEDVIAWTISVNGHCDQERRNPYPSFLNVDTNLGCELCNGRTQNAGRELAQIWFDILLLTSGTSQTAI